MKKEQLINTLNGYHDKIKNRVKYGEELLEAIRDCNNFVEANLSHLGKEPKKLIFHFNSIFEGIENRQLRNPVKYISNSHSMEDYRRDAYHAITLIKSRIVSLIKDDPL